jgi:G protein-coupled receptor GPR1
MSVHMYLQIFSTGSKMFGHDGLYRFRHSVLAGWFVFPFLCGILAFVRGREGYIAQGPFCTLPIRPYWYRLALQWIPRYLIWLYIMIVAVRIYLHVGHGFKVFAREDNMDSSTNIQSLGTMPGVESPELRVAKKRGNTPTGELQDLSGLTDGHRASAKSNSSQANHSTWPTSHNPSSDGFKMPFTGHSRRSSHVVILADENGPHDHQVPPETKLQRHSMSSTISSWRASTDMPAGVALPGANLEPIEEGYQSDLDKTDVQSGDTPLKKRRRAIQRQLRLLFIYPITYLMVWTIPFIYHSMNYSDHYAANPIPILATLSTLSLTIAGSVDCIVFGWREKPWQHVPGSDGTFIGSFKFWTFSSKKRAWSTPAPKPVPPAKLSAPARLSNKAKKWSQSHGHGHGVMSEDKTSRQASAQSTKPMISQHKKTFSGTSDRANRAADQAFERLALERADRQSRLITMTSNRASSLNPAHEWFERRLSDCVNSPTLEKDEFVPTPSDSATPSPIKEDFVATSPSATK